MREFGLRGGPRRRQVRCVEGNTQDHVLTVRYVDVTGAMERRADRQQGKAAPEQRVHRIGDLDVCQFLIVWVIEGGIKVGGRSIPSTTGNS
jgi:hypothetical protein